MKIAIARVLCFATLVLSGVNGENPPLSEKLVYVPGVVGEAAQGRSRFPAEIISPSAGAIQCWVKLEEPPGKMKYHHLWGIGVNKPGWFTSYINKGCFVVTSKTKIGESSLSVDLSKWKTGQWHNLAVCWGVYHKKSKILIYIDGHLKGKLDNASLPAEFNGDSLCLGFNSASFKGVNFGGAIDELAIWSLPLHPSKIKKIFLMGKKQKAMRIENGMVLLAHFNNNANWSAGGESGLKGKKLKKYLRAALKDPVPKKYKDEISTEYSYNREMKEKSPTILTDGGDRSMITWRNFPLEVIFELPYTADLRLIEIATPKPTIWYRLEELQVSLDTGNGEFSDPKIITTYGESPKQTKKVIDDSCKTYIYQWRNPGKACRVKITLNGKGYMALGEVRICGKPVK